MPRALARAFTSTSSCFGTRILICSSFFSNSNRAALNWEKSRLDRSRARKVSACLSVLSLGTFFFFGFYSADPRFHNTTQMYMHDPQGYYADMKFCAVCAFSFGLALAQQPTGKPTFEVASIKPFDPDSSGQMWTGMSVDAGMVRYTNISLRACIRT